MRWVNKFGIAIMLLVIYGMLAELMPEDVKPITEVSRYLMFLLGWALLSLPKKGDE